ncbi:MAG: transposase [Polaromonas sp.]|nr:transposase [Polaromonas sp.]
MLAAFFQTVKGACTGLSIADATPLAVCDNLRIKRHKVFQDVAQRGKSSPGWFYGFKLHAVINHQGEIVAIKLTPGKSMTARACCPLSRTCLARCTPTRATSAKSLPRR